MSQKSRKPTSAKRSAKKAGRPPGTPKTGGRQPGTPNKSNARLRTQFSAQGFDFVKEFIAAYDELDIPFVKIQVLMKMAPYFMQRLREDVEAVPPEKPDSEQEALRGLPTSDLLSMLPGRSQSGH